MALGFGPFSFGLGLVAIIANALEVGVVVCSAFSLWLDVIDGCSLGDLAFGFARLAQMLVAFEYGLAGSHPCRSIAALMPACRGPCHEEVIQCETPDGIPIRRNFGLCG
jgi:hypothetical protein